MTAGSIQNFWDGGTANQAAIVGTALSVCTVIAVTVLFFTVPEFTQFAQSYSPKLFWSCYTVTALLVVSLPTVLLLRQIGGSSKNEDLLVVKVPFEETFSGKAESVSKEKTIKYCYLNSNNSYCIEEKILKEIEKNMKGKEHEWYICFDIEKTPFVDPVIKITEIAQQHLDQYYEWCRGLSCCDQAIYRRKPEVEVPEIQIPLVNISEIKDNAGSSIATKIGACKNSFDKFPAGCSQEKISAITYYNNGIWQKSVNSETPLSEQKDSVEYILFLFMSYAKVSVHGVDISASEEAYLNEHFEYRPELSGIYTNFGTQSTQPYIVIYQKKSEVKDPLDCVIETKETPKVAEKLSTLNDQAGLSVTEKIDANNTKFEELSGIPKDKTMIHLKGEEGIYSMKDYLLNDVNNAQLKEFLIFFIPSHRPMKIKMSESEEVFLNQHFEYCPERSGTYTSLHSAPLYDFL